MDWKQVDRYQWRITEPGFSGRAALKETNHGFIASVTVRNEEFDMELLDERDFFESRDDAITFLKEQMGRSSY